MFCIGEYVYYGNSGICKVIDILWMQPSRESQKKQYYFLQPNRERTGKIYIPVDNEKVVIRSLMTKEEVERLFGGAEEIQPITGIPQKELEAEYKKKIRSCDAGQWLELIKSLSMEKKRREDAGKKFTATDERYLREATERLLEEAVFVLRVDKAQVQQMIAEVIEDKKEYSI